MKLEISDRIYFRVLFLVIGPQPYLREMKLSPSLDHIIPRILKPGEIGNCDINFGHIIIPEEVAAISVFEAQPAILHFCTDLSYQVFSGLNNYLVFGPLLDEKFDPFIDDEFMKRFNRNFL